MQKRIVLFIGLLALIGATAIPQHLIDAETLVQHIKPSNNSYEHRGCFIKWKGVDGATRYENQSDCSDFLALLLRHSYGVTSEQLEAWTGRSRPYANNWHDAIAASRGFTKIEKLSAAQAGDVLAIRFPPGSADFGHVMLMCNPAELVIARAPLVPHTQQWNVTVIDSSKSPHGGADTRRNSDGSSVQGVGSGVVRVYTDGDGNVMGYCWSDAVKSKFESQADRNMVIGRLDIQK